MKQLYSRIKTVAAISVFFLFFFCGNIFAQHSTIYFPVTSATPDYGDSLAGFNESALLAKASAKGLDAYETKMYINQYKRKFINREYHLNVAPPNTDLSALRIPNSVAMAPCTNMDFETASFAGWTGFIGDNSVSSNGPLQNITAGIFSNGQDALISDMNARHTIVSAASGNDAYGLFPCVCPGGNYSCRLGNTYANYQGEAIEQTFTVAPGNTSFTYQYAVVLNDGGHSSGEQPYFRIEMFDQSGNLIPCAQYYVEAAGGNTPGFSPSAIDPLTYYKPWTTVSADLTAYLASTVTIRFTAAGCIYAGHFGYAYVDASCLPYQITSSDSLCQGGNITLTAPIGAASYLWSPGGQTTQSINVSTAGSYTVTMVSVTGCTTTLTKNVVVYPNPVPAFTANSTACASNFAFTNNSTISSGTLTYHWDFGDPSTLGDTSNVANPNYTYNTAGSYTVTLTVTSSNGCTATTTQVVNPASGGNAAFTNTTVCQGTATAFTDGSTNATAWDWNFGDPASGPADSSLVQNPSHVFTGPGTYTVTLTAGMNPCTSTITNVVTVNATPVPSFVYNQICGGSSVNFTSTSTIANPSTITSTAWDFGDPASGGNNLSTLLNPSHTFTALGTYTVTITVTGTGGCTQTTTQIISVLPPPTTAFTASTVCTNSPMIFTNNSLNATSSHWDFGVAALTNDTSNQTNPTYTYSTAGTYTVSLISNPGPCADTATLSVTVAPGPSVQFVAPVVCLGSPTSFTDQSSIASGNIVSWSWDFGVNATSTDTSSAQNPIYTYNSAGTFTVSLTCTSNNGCSTTDTVSVTVSALPNANFTSNVVCQGNPTVFTDLSSSNITGWTWDFGDASATSNSQNPTHIYANDTTYNVMLIVMNAAGCIDTIITPAVVASTPNVLFTADTFAGCPQLCVNFADLSTINSGNIATWSWDFGDGSLPSSQQNPSHCYSNTGTYTVTLTCTSNGGCIQTLVIPNMITVYPVPHASFSASPMTTTVLNTHIYFTDLSSGNPATWQWTFGDPTTLGDSSSIQNPNYQYTSEYGDTYPVNLIVTNQYGCVDDTTLEIIVEPEFTFYIPNAFTPNGDGINDGFFGTGIGITKYQIWVFDRWGNLIFTSTDINQAWDGSVQGKGGDIAQIDVYVWKVQLTDVFDKQHKYIGHVSLIK